MVTGRDPPADTRLNSHSEKTQFSVTFLTGLSWAVFSSAGAQEFAMSLCMTSCVTSSICMQNFVKLCFLALEVFGLFESGLERLSLSFVHGQECRSDALC